MACKVIRSEDGTVVAIVCGSPWGIGTYKYGEDEHGNDEIIYGFPPSEMNPHDFDPDRECCTPAEIAAWEEACRVFDQATNAPLVEPPACCCCGDHLQTGDGLCSHCRVHGA